MSVCNYKLRRFVFISVFVLLTTIAVVFSGCAMTPEKIYTDSENKQKIVGELEKQYGGSYSIVSMIDNNTYNCKRVVVHDDENDFDFTCFTWYCHFGLTPFDGKTEWVLDEDYEAAKKNNELAAKYSNVRLIESDDKLYSFNIDSKRLSNNSAPYHMVYSIILTTQNEEQLREAFSQLIEIDKAGAGDIYLEYTGDGCDEYPPIRYNRIEPNNQDSNTDQLNYFDYNEFGSDERYTDSEFENYDINQFIAIYTGERNLYYFFDEVE